MRPASSQTRPAPTAGAAATVAISAQGDRSVLTPHTLTATMGGGATSVAWTSSTGTFDSASSLTPTYTPTTIGAQEVTCTPTGPLGAGAPDGEGWAVSRPLPVAANATISTVTTTLALQTEALSDTASADGVTWSTVVQRYTTSNTLEGTEAVTGSTTTGPTWTPSALDKVYRATSTATDAYGRTSATVRAVSAATASATDLTVSLSTGATVNQASPAGQVITATPTGGTGSKSYAWSATYINSGADAVALLSASTGNPVTLTTTAYSQRVMVVCTVTDSGTPTPQVAVAAVGVVVANTPIVFSNPAPQSSTTAGPATVTFATATGGVGTLTPGTASLAKPATSGATLTGTGYGDFDFDTDVPGTYAVTQSVEDENEQTVQATGVVTYAPVGPTWTVTQTTDWTSCTNDSRSTAGTLNVYETDGTTLKKAVTVFLDGTVTGSVAATNGTGLVITMATGTGAMYTFWAAAAPTSGQYKVAAQFLMTNVDFATAGVQTAGFSTTSTPASGTQSYATIDKNAGNYRIRTVYRTGGTPTVSAALYSNATQFISQMCVTIINDGKQVSIYVHDDVDDFVPMDSLPTAPLAPRSDQGPANTTPAAYARLYTGTPTLLAAVGGAALVNTITKSRSLETLAES